jgi:magnesium chelatase accessory protein
MPFLTVKPDWAREGRDWPNRDSSRFVFAAGFRWHVQVMGEGPPLLLLHGTGSATHSWRDLAPELAHRFTIIAPDLPGHGFTETPAGEGLSLPGMARSLAVLLEVLQVQPMVVVGHSAGAAVALRLILDGRLHPAAAVSLNGALRPFPGAAGQIFPAMARLLFLNPFAQQAFAWRASAPGAVRRLIESTGSRIDERGLESYRALLSTTGHVAGALGMMARWDLEPLQADLGRLAVPVTFVVGDGDLAVPPQVSQEAQARSPGGVLIRLPGLGHLAHEEAPVRAAQIVRDAAGL